MKTAEEVLRKMKYPVLRALTEPYQSADRDKLLKEDERRKLIAENVLGMP